MFDIQACRRFDDMEHVCDAIGNDIALFLRDQALCDDFVRFDARVLASADILDPERVVEQRENKHLAAAEVDTVFTCNDRMADGSICGKTFTTKQVYEYIKPTQVTCMHIMFVEFISIKL